MIIIVEIACFLFLLWFGRFVCRKCMKRQQRVLAYFWIIVVLGLQVIVIYYFVGTFIEQMTAVLQMFYNGT